MKKLLLLIQSLFILSANAQTSIYHPLPDSNAIWNFQFFLGWGFATGNYSITITGDTSINGITYHKLFTPFINSNPPGWSTGITTGYRGAFRQENMNKKVFIVPPTASVEQLLYDFNLQVGDTLHGYLETYITGWNTDVVQSIDSVLVNGNYHKRWTINQFYNIQMIDGIGSNYGLIEFSPGTTTDQNTYELSCFSRNGSTLYPTSTTLCALITNVPDITNRSSPITIFPEPFHISTTIRLNDEFQNSELKIFNSLGKLVRKDYIMNRSTYTLYRDHLFEGIYFIQLKNQQGLVVTAKFIVE